MFYSRQRLIFHLNLAHITLAVKPKTRSTSISVNYASLHNIYRTDHVFTRKKEIALSCYTPKHFANRDPQISAGNRFELQCKTDSGDACYAGLKKSYLTCHGNPVFSYALATFINMLFVRLNQLLISGTFMEIKKLPMQLNDHSFGKLEKLHGQISRHFEPICCDKTTETTGETFWF